jgi:signal transduction histidine kinase
MSRLAERPKPRAYEEVLQRLQKALAALRARVNDTQRQSSMPRSLATQVAEGVERTFEDPVAKLVQSNAALRQTVRSLRSLDDLDSFLAEVLQRMVEQVGAASAALFVADEHEGLHLTWVVENGRLQRGGESQHPNANRPLPFTAYRSHLEAVGFREGMPQVTSGLVCHDEPARIYLEQLGVKSVITIPVLLDDAIAATFHLRLHDERRPAPQDLQIAQSLADQTSLAFRLTGLAAKARAAAVDQQEEKAARQRAESVARLANASRRTLERLAVSADPDAFLGHVVTVAAEQFGAVGGGVWRTETDGSTRIVVSLEDGQVLPQGRSPLPTIEITPQALKELIARGREVAIDDAETIATKPPYANFREYLASKGVKAVLRMPLFLGDQFRGVMTLWLPEMRQLSAEETELAAALANQAVLAMELTRLTQSARAAAITGERNRLARDFHDTLAQGLATIILHLETAVSVCPGSAARPHITAATDLARDSLIEARRSIRALRPAGLDGRGLGDALAEVTSRLSRLSTATLRSQTHGARTPMPGDVEEALLRIATEALTNATKHARARNIDMDVMFEDRAVRLAVRDDGIGFDGSGFGQRNVGLSSMRERAHSIGAALTIASEPGGGSEVLVYWTAPAREERPQ